MPLADKRGGVVRLQGLGDGDFTGRQTRGVRGLDDFMRKPGANGVTAGQQASAGRRADVCRGVEIREAHAFQGHSVKIGRPDVRPAIAADIAEPEVVGQDDDHVRLSHTPSSTGCPQASPCRHPPTPASIEASPHRTSTP